MSFTQVALTGTIEASPGVALQAATVTATLSGEMSDGATVITPLGVSARTAADGTFSLTVPANDDTTTTPAGRFYNITVQSQSGQVLDQFAVVVPHASAPTVALYSLARVGATAASVVYGVVSFNARTGIVVLSKADVTGTGLAAADVGADVAGAAAAAQTAAQSFATSAVATETTRAETAEALLAPKASPAFTGTPTAPTPAALDSTTKLATTAYVQGSLAAYVPVASDANRNTKGAGTGALASLTSGTANTALGDQAGTAITSAASCTAIGDLALAAASAGPRNTAVGGGALQSAGVLVGSQENTAIGSSALQNTTASGCTGVGTEALQTATTGADNTAVGQYAGQGVTTGAQNTLVGKGAGFQVTALTTGTGNTLIGWRACPTAAGVNNATAVGLSATADGGSTAIGISASAAGNPALAAGNSATTTATYASAIGVNTSATAAGAVAIGCDHTGAGAASVTQDLIVLGTGNHTVSVPGAALNVGSHFSVSGASLTMSGLGAFAAGDKYLVISAAGAIHVSALGPAS